MFRNSIKINVSTPIMYYKKEYKGYNLKYS